MKTIGERIRQARNYRGLSGEALASKVGYEHQSAIGNLENRNSGRGGSKIVEIAAALNFPVSWFLSGPDTDDLRSIDPTLLNAKASNVNERDAKYVVDPRRKIAAILERLPPEVLPDLLSYVEFLQAKGPSSSQHVAGDHVPAQKRAA